MLKERIINKKNIILSALIGSILLTGCGGENVTATTIPAIKNSGTSVKNIDLLSALNNAKEIELKEKVLSIGAGYDVYADDILVGEITGKYINTAGDVFKLKDLKGNVIKSEKQIKKWNVKQNRMAEVYDKNNNISGYIGEEKTQDMFKLGHTFHFYDKNKKEIGYTNQEIFSLTDTHEIYDMKNNLDYLIEEEFASSKHEYEICVYDTSNIPVENVTLYTAIQSEITKSDKAKETEKKKKTTSTANKVIGTAGVANSNKNSTSNKTNTSTAVKNNTLNKTTNITTKNNTSTTNSELNLNKGATNNKTNSYTTTSKKNTSTSLNKKTLSSSKYISTSKKR